MTSGPWVSVNDTALQQLTYRTYSEGQQELVPHLHTVCFLGNFDFHEQYHGRISLEWNNTPLRTFAFSSRLAPKLHLELRTISRVEELKASDWISCLTRERYAGFIET
jgi:hypothetical protein